jgi:hypothetical protein
MTFLMVNDAKDKAGAYAAFWEVDSPIFSSEKHGVIEQWKIEQLYGVKASGSFSLLEER